MKMKLNVKERDTYKVKHGTDPDPNDKRTNYSKALSSYTDLMNTVKDDEFRRTAIEQLICNKTNLPLP